MSSYVSGDFYGVQNYSQPVPPNYPPPRPLTQKIHAETRELLGKANEIVSSSFGSTPVFPKPVQTKSINPIYLDMSDRSVNILSSKTTNIHNHSNTKSESAKDKNDAAIRIIAVIVGLIATFVSTYVLGKVMAGKEDADSKQSDFKFQCTQWSLNKDVYDNYRDYQLGVDIVCAKVQAVLANRSTQHMYNIAQSVGFIACGMIAVVGGVMASEALMTAALIGGTACLLVTVGRYAYQSASKFEARELDLVNKELWKLNGQEATIQSSFRQPLTNPQYNQNQNPFEFQF